MRAGSLRALLRELRAGGVSEYSHSDKRGGTVTIKLAGPFAVAARDSNGPGKAAAKATTAFPPISSALRRQLEELGVNPDDAHEVLRSAGISAGADGN